jgi:hypothetical protein
MARDRDLGAVPARPLHALRAAQPVFEHCEEAYVPDNQIDGIRASRHGHHAHRCAVWLPSFFFHVVSIDSQARDDWASIHEPLQLVARLETASRKSSSAARPASVAQHARRRRRSPA